jgi:hypothetical protein
MSMATGSYVRTLIKDEDEFESLLIPFEMMNYGVKIDMIPPKYGGTGSISVDGKTLPFMFDDEKLYWEISMPTRDDMDTLKWFELNPPALLGETLIRRRKHQDQPHHIPWEEWHHRLAMLPEDVVKRTVWKWRFRRRLSSPVARILRGLATPPSKHVLF